MLRGIFYEMKFIGENMNAIIRDAVAKDMEGILAMAKDLATSFSVESEQFCTSFHEALNTTNAYLLVAEKNEGPVGYLLGFDHPTFYANGRVSWVEEVYVKQANRKEGLGCLLMRTFEEEAKCRGSRLVALATRRAESFYQSIGYEASATYFKKHL